MPQNFLESANKTNLQLAFVTAWDVPDLAMLHTANFQPNQTWSEASFANFFPLNQNQSAKPLLKQSQPTYMGLKLFQTATTNRLAQNQNTNHKITAFLLWQQVTLPLATTTSPLTSNTPTSNLHALISVDILTFLTDAAYRRRGQAQYLLTCLFQLLSQYPNPHYQSHAIEIFLEVATNNHAACQLYQQNGFTKQQLRRHYYGSGQDAWVLVKKISIV